jgi:hypothetical protein
MYIIADIEAQEKATLYERLNAAVAAAHADPRTKTGMGVLVTRHNFDRFSVPLSPNVPFGITQERDQACRN